MEKTFIISYTEQNVTITDEYTVKEVTAICCDDMWNGNTGPEYRQNALLVTNYYNGEKFEYVVFGYEMPETTDDFMYMSDDSEAWESNDALESIQDR